MQSPRDGIGGAAQGVEVLTIEKGDAVVERQAFSGHRFIQDFANRRSHDVIHMDFQAFPFPFS
jgi:hypothetical protein